uniref:Perilipin 1 n=1 Tax=Felis catus TaxID=9685 RepID=A0ABI7XD74_FELCA
MTAINKGPALPDGDLPEQENVLQRVLQLPVVSGTCECFQKTYTSTKEAYPLVASVCNAYEKGVQGASSLAAWSMEPVVRRLSTQCESSWPLQATIRQSVRSMARLSVCRYVCAPSCLSDRLSNHLHPVTQIMQT